MFIVYKSPDTGLNNNSTFKSNYLIDFHMHRVTFNIQLICFLIIGNAPIMNGLAAVVVDGLNCRVTYNITAGGKLNGTLVGPRSLHGTVTAGPCPINSVNTISDTGKHILMNCSME